MPTSTEHRLVSARIYTSFGWLTGQFHVPKRANFIDFIGLPTPFYNLVEVSFEKSSQPLAFFSLQRQSALLIVTQDPAEMVLSANQPDHKPHHVLCLLMDGVVEGILNTTKLLRVSDHISKGKDFILVSDASVRGKKLEASHLDHVIVNVKTLVGVSELYP